MHVVRSRTLDGLLLTFHGIPRTFRGPPRNAATSTPWRPMGLDTTISISILTSIFTAVFAATPTRKPRSPTEGPTEASTATPTDTPTETPTEPPTGLPTKTFPDIHGNVDGNTNSETHDHACGHLVCVVRNIGSIPNHKPYEPQAEVLPKDITRGKKLEMFNNVYHYRRIAVSMAVDRRRFPGELMPLDVRGSYRGN